VLPIPARARFISATPAQTPLLTGFNLELQRASLQLWQKYNGRLGTAAYLLICILHHVLRAGHCELRAWFDVLRKRQWRDKLEQHLPHFNGWASDPWSRRSHATHPATTDFPIAQERRRMPQLAADSRRRSVSVLSATSC